MATHTVKAKEPTVLDGQTHYTLYNSDLMIGFKVDTAHVVPGAIDMDRFDDALARTLQIYPVHAGRIARPRDTKSPWRIRLSNAGVPVIVTESGAKTEVPTSAVVQDPWTLTEGVRIWKYLDYDSEEPLLKVTIVRFKKTGSTSIGLSSSHMIGDGHVVLSFARLLSQNYQGLEPLDPPPSYAPISPYPFNPDDYGEVPTPDYEHLYPLRGGAPHLVPGRKKPGRMDIRLTAAQIAELHRGVLAMCRDPNPPILSRQDSLSALLAYCISKSDPETLPIQHISTLLMSRGIPPRSKYSAGDALIWAMTDAVEDFDKETPFTIALRIRNAIARCRDPGYAAAFEAVHAKKALDAINADLAQDFVQRPGYMVVNSTWRFDWTSAHFGFPGQVRFFHTVLDEPRYVKMFQPNPAQLPDGTWAKRSKDDIEITFYVYKELQEVFKNIFTAQVQALDMSGEIEWVNSA